MIKKYDTAIPTIPQAEKITQAFGNTESLKKTKQIRQKQEILVISVIK